MIKRFDQTFYQEVNKLGNKSKMKMIHILSVKWTLTPQGDTTIHAEESTKIKNIDFTKYW